MTQQLTFEGKPLIQLDSVASTNQYARELTANTRPEEGTAIMAREQTAGRGQAGNYWYSGSGRNLAVSYILYPSFLKASMQFYLNMAVSLAVRECAEDSCGQEVQIKWPNDIYAGRRKLAGILIENTVSGEYLGQSIAGVGLNVNETGFPDDLVNPVSLRQLAGKELVISKVEERLKFFLGKYYAQLQMQHLNFLERAYVESLYLYQQTATFYKGGQAFRGEIIGLTKEGRLIISSGGKELRFAFKEVEYAR